MRFLPLPSKTVKVSTGTFACSRCGCLSQYVHKERYQRVLIMLIVPFLGDKIEEYVECQSCGERFPPGVLRGAMPVESQQILGDLKAKLESGLSVEDAKSMLSEAGIDVPTIQKYVSVAAGIRQKRCPQCQLNYSNKVVKCSKCGHALPVAGNQTI